MLIFVNDTRYNYGQIWKSRKPMAAGFLQLDKYVSPFFVEFVPLSKAAEYGPEHAARPGVPAPADTKV